MLPRLGLELTELVGEWRFGCEDRCTVGGLMDDLFTQCQRVAVKVDEAEG